MDRPVRSKKKHIADDCVDGDEFDEVSPLPPQRKPKLVIVREDQSETGVEYVGGGGGGGGVEHEKKIKKKVNKKEEEDEEYNDIEETPYKKQPNEFTKKAYPGRNGLMPRTTNNVGIFGEVKCQYCNANMFIKEKIGGGGVNKGGSEAMARNEARNTVSPFLFSLCCSQGAVRVEPLCQPSIEIRDLYTKSDKNGKLFREHIRHYNSTFSMASTGVHLSNGNIRFGISENKIEGEVI